MSFSNSWLAVRAPEQSVLLSLGLEKTGKRGDPGRHDWGSAQTGDWTLVWSPRFEPSKFRDAASKLNEEIIVCDVEEHVMFASASAFKGGRLAWRIVHDAQKARDHLAVEGMPPDSFGIIRHEELARMDSDREVDFVFEIPVRVAEAAVGFRHDSAEMPPFGILKDIDADQKKWWKFW